MYGAGKVNRLDFYKVKWHLKMYVVVLKVKAILVMNPSSVKHKMQIVSREDAVGIQGLPGPLVAVSALCSRLDQVSRSLLSYEVSEIMGLALFTVKLHIKHVHHGPRSYMSFVCFMLEHWFHSDLSTGPADHRSTQRHHSTPLLRWVVLILAKFFILLIGEEEI